MGARTCRRQQGKINGCKSGGNKNRIGCSGDFRPGFLQRPRRRRAFCRVGVWLIQRFEGFHRRKQDRRATIERRVDEAEVFGEMSKKALSFGTAASGGYLVPDEVRSDLFVGAVRANNVLFNTNVLRVTSSGGAPIRIPKISAGHSGGWIAENDSTIGAASRGGAGSTASLRHTAVT